LILQDDYKAICAAPGRLEAERMDADCHMIYGQKREKVSHGTSTSGIEAFASLGHELAG